MFYIFYKSLKKLCKFFFKSSDTEYAESVVVLFNKENNQTFFENFCELNGFVKRYYLLRKLCKYAMIFFKTRILKQNWIYVYFNKKIWDLH